MEKALLKILYDKVCLSFGTSCTGCTFWPVREELGAACCADFIEDYPKEAALSLARFIAGDVALNKPENKKDATPETRREILQAAERCVCGDRDLDYGSPENSFEAIGALWGAYLWHKNDLGKPGNTVGKNFIEPKDVAAMMTLFKMARVATGQDKADNWVDAAGYAACGGEIAADKEAGRNGN